MNTDQYVLSTTPMYWAAKNLTDSFRGVDPAYTTDFFMSLPGVWCWNKVPLGIVDDPVITAVFEPFAYGVWLSWLGVYPNCRGQGYAKRFLAFLQTLYPCIELQVGRYNKAARNLYLQCGFNISTIHEFRPKQFTMVWAKRWED